MTRIIIPLILLISSGLLFWGLIDPAYGEIKKMKKEETLYNQALSNSKELQGIRDNLLKKYNSLSQEDLERLEKLLPDTVDNVKLIMDIDGIAGRYGMSLKSVSVKTPTTQKSVVLGKNEEPVGAISLSFSVSGPYKSFINFLKDMESSLRIVDIETISFNASDKDANIYEMEVKTYWLR